MLQCHRVPFGVGIRVNDRLETSDPSILAAGDAAEVVDAVGGAGVDRRIDVMATVVHFGGTIDEIPGDRPVLVHYQVGRFSNFACRILMGLGRRDVVSPSGRYAAYAEWQEASGGLPA